MNYLCFGTGAIGTYIGGSLAYAGNKVVFVDSAEVEAIVSRQGLRLGLHSGMVKIEKPQIVSSLISALDQGPYDAGILAIKSFDTPGFVEEINPYRSQLPPILCLQNGVENESVLEVALGDGGVIPATVTSSIGKKGPGEIVVERLRGVGVFNGHSLSGGILQDFNAAGLNALPYKDRRSMKWSKMLTNLLVNATSAILDLTPREVLKSKEGYRLEIAQLREALTVMDVLHIPVVDLPGTPVRGLAFLVRTLPEILGRPLLIKAGASGRGDKMPSLHIDLHAGRKKLEVNYLNGAVVRFGKQVGIPTPVNEILDNILNQMAEGKISLAAFSKKPHNLWLEYLKVMTV